jgi:hypothetical protein
MIPELAPAKRDEFIAHGVGERSMILRHKTFVGPSVYTQGPNAANEEAIRAAAEEFVNDIGIENTVSIAEHVTTLGPFVVVVWYRAEGPPREENPVVTITNAQIRRLRDIADRVCPACGYDLTGNASGTCPERGHVLKT